jgi:N-dimethylarginine dimethylaminohydrolase
VSVLSKLNVYTEYGKLRKVIVGPADTLPPLTSHINAIQEYYFPTNPPKLEKIIREHKRFVEVLKANGTEVIYAKKIAGCDQRDIRDIGIVLNSKYLVCRVIEKIRECEVNGLNDFLKTLNKDEIVRCEEGYIEGGDLIIDKDSLYVGIGQRTNNDGYELIKNKFGEIFDVVPIKIIGNHSHLDTIFNIISEELAIAFPEGLEAETLNYLKKRYQIIEVTRKEQFQLATNMLALSPNKIVMDANRNPRIATELNNLGLRIVDVDFSETNKIGGSFRCGSLPLYRD